MCVGISVVLTVQALRATVSPQELLVEAAREGGPLQDIFSQQASQGYYDDALETARLSATNSPNQQYELAGYVEELIKIRGENGDIRGAGEMIQRFNDSLLAGRGPKAMREIAEIRVDKGDLRGALQGCTSPEDTNAVMEEFGNRQIENSDFNGALKTTELVSERSAYNLFYAIGDALRQRGEQERLQELASHMTDRKRAAEFVEAARFTLYPEVQVVRAQATPCDIATHDGNIDSFAEAWALVDENNCRYSSFIAVRQYPSDPMKPSGNCPSAPTRRM